MTHEHPTDYLQGLQQSLYRLLHEFCDHDLAVKATLTVIASLSQEVSLGHRSYSEYHCPLTSAPSVCNVMCSLRADHFGPNSAFGSLGWHCDSVSDPRARRLQNRELSVVQLI